MWPLTWCLGALYGPPWFVVRPPTPSAAVSQQGLLFIYCQIGYLQHHPVVPYLRPLAPAVRLPVSPRKTAARPTSCTVLCCLYCSSLAITLAILTPIRQPKYLHAAPGDNRRSAHIRVTAAYLRSLLLTDLVCRYPRPVLSDHTHTHITLATLTPIRPPNYLSADPDDGRCSAHTRAAATPFRSIRRQLQHWHLRHSAGIATYPPPMPAQTTYRCTPSLQRS